MGLWVSFRAPTICKAVGLRCPAFCGASQLTCLQGTESTGAARQQQGPLVCLGEKPFQLYHKQRGYLESHSMYICIIHICIEIEILMCMYILIKKYRIYKYVICNLCMCLYAVYIIYIQHVYMYYSLYNSDSL